jgi:hypothetical protein
VRRQGFPESFVRMWRWYLAYCEGGFLERSIGDVHRTLDRVWHAGRCLGRRDAAVTRDGVQLVTQAGSRPGIARLK